MVSAGLVPRRRRPARSDDTPPPAEPGRSADDRYLDRARRGAVLVRAVHHDPSRLAKRSLPRRRPATRRSTWQHAVRRSAGAGLSGRSGPVRERGDHLAGLQRVGRSRSVRCLLRGLPPGGERPSRRAGQLRSAVSPREWRRLPAPLGVAVRQVAGARGEGGRLLRRRRPRAPSGACRGSPPAGLRRSPRVLVAADEGDARGGHRQWRQRRLPVGQ